MSHDPASGPLSTADTAQLAAAIERAGQIRKAAKFATVNGWVLAISAVLTAPFALFDAVSFLLFFALAGLAWNAFRGRKMLAAFREEGADLLWKNEIGLLLVVVLYCAWGIRSVVSGPLHPSLAELEMLLPDVGGLVDKFIIAIYAVIIFTTLIFQGAMARFYHGRIAVVREYLAETPEWVVEVMRIVQGGAARTPTAALSTRRPPPPAPPGDSPEGPPATK